MRLRAPIESVFGFFANASNLERMTPPDLRFRIVGAPAEISAGCLIDYRLRLDGVPFGWTTKIPLWEPPSAFVDEQLRGPYRQWIHRHDFLRIEGGGTLIEDRVDLVLPMPPLGEVAWPYVRLKVRRIFEFRQRAVAAAFGESAWAYPPEVSIDGDPPLKTPR
jgi:ligand-binding SRPBCC domain-containing protein